LGYIGFRIGVSKNERDGTYWFYDTLDEIAKHYPYLRRSAIYEAIRRLTAKDGLLVVGHFNKRKGDRTNWYAFRNESTADLLKKKPLYFKVEDAAIYGVPAAVLLNNLAYHIIKKRKEQPHFRLQSLSASSLAVILPFSRSTIQRALKLLVEEGVLLYCTTPDTTQPTQYCFAHIQDLEQYAVGTGLGKPVLEELVENKEHRTGQFIVKNVGVIAEPLGNAKDTHVKSQKTRAESNPNSTGLAERPLNPILTHNKPAQARIQQMVGANQNRVGSKANELGSNPNDYTILINPLENLFGKDSLKRSDVLETRTSAVSDIHSLSDQHRLNHSTILSEKSLSYP
jgi:hypothetical protein